MQLWQLDCYNYDMINLYDNTNTGSVWADSTAINTAIHESKKKNLNQVI